MSGKFYITTPIFYPSNYLTLGNCYPAVMCDAIARFKKMQGKEVFFLTGSDEQRSGEATLENIAIQEAITKLNPREKEILTLRYYVGKTQMEVSDEVGISQAQVSRLEKNALEIIRKNIS